MSLSRSPKHPGIRLKPSQLQPATVMLRLQAQRMQSDREFMGRPTLPPNETEPAVVKFDRPMSEAAE